MPTYNHQERADLAITLADACLRYRHHGTSQGNDPDWRTYQRAVKAYEDYLNANGIQVKANAAARPEAPQTTAPEVPPVVMGPVVAPPEDPPPIQQDQGLNTQRERPLSLPPRGREGRPPVSPTRIERDTATATPAPSRPGESPGPYSHLTGAELNDGAGATVASMPATTLETPPNETEVSALISLLTYSSLPRFALIVRRLAYQRDQLLTERKR